MMPIGDRHDRIGWNYIEMIKSRRMFGQRVQQEDRQPAAAVRRGDRSTQHNCVGQVIGCANRKELNAHRE
jgi:hypothetical protein